MQQENKELRAATAVLEDRVEQLQQHLLD